MKTLIAVKESRTNNYGENIKFGTSALNLILQILLNTPKGMHPFNLMGGFDMMDLLFKADGSPSFKASVDDLTTQIENATGNQNVSVSIRRDGTTNEIEISLEQQVIIVDVQDKGNTTFDVNIKDIIIK